MTKLGMKSLRCTACVLRGTDRQCMSQANRTTLEPGLLECLFGQYSTLSNLLVYFLLPDRVETAFMNSQTLL